MGVGGIEQILFKDTNLQGVVNKPVRSNAQHSEYRQCYITINKLVKRLEFNYSNH